MGSGGALKGRFCAGHLERSRHLPRLLSWCGLQCWKILTKAEGYSCELYCIVRWMEIRFLIFLLDVWWLGSCCLLRCWKRTRRLERCESWEATEESLVGSSVILCC